MKNRRKQLIPDSLEMLLDTMCNTFGGIILIALMVALLAKDARMNQIEADTQVETEAILKNRLTRAEEDLKTALEFKARLEDQSGDPTFEERVRLLSQREQARAEHQATREDLEKTRESLRSMSETVAEVKAVQKELEAQQARVESEKERREQQSRTLEQEIAEMQRQVAGQMNQRVRRLRLPREHATRKDPVEIVVRHGELFPVRLFSGPASTFNRQGFVLRPIEGGIEELTPVQGKGLNPESNLASVIRYFRTVPQNSYLVFRVYEDSFNAYNLAKQAATRVGMELTWVPLTADIKILIGGSGAAAPPPL